jgi:hypothetical protein
MNPDQPRLLPDFAAVPTRAERDGTARYWQARQTSLVLTDDPSTTEPCACCASNHETDACPHGTALTLTTTGDNDQ